MALNGQLIWGPISNGAYFSFEWTATQNISARTSTVSWKMYGRGRSSSPTYIASNYHLSIDGSEISALTGSWDGSSKFSFNNALKDSGSFTVYHDSSGAGSFYASIYAFISSSSYNWATVDGTFSLDNIGSLGPYYSWVSLGQNDITGSASVAFDLAANQVGYYWYQPPSDGTIDIYSTGSTDTYGGWGTGMSLSSTQTSGGSIVTGESYTDDDSGDGNNFKCTGIPVTAGTWGQVFVHGYSNAASGTLYVDFTPSSYTVTFNANGGSNPPSAVSCAPGESVTIPTTIPTLSNRRFLGWTTDSTSAWGESKYLPGVSYTPTANITLYAVWGYILTINPNGGNMISGSAINANGEGEALYSTSSYTVGFTKTNYYGRDLANFANGYWYRTIDDISYYNRPTRTGYTFNGWSVTSGNGQVVYEAPNTTHKQLFYDDNKYCYIRTVGETYALYYYINSETTPSNSTITAQWTANTYYVAYNSNGGSGTMSNSTHTYGTASNLSTNTFTYTGYKFIGWNTDSSATTALYTDGQSVTNLTSTNGATITLYAIWALDSFTVTLTAKTGIDSVSGGGAKTVGDSVTISATLKTGYRWTGWFNSGTTTMVSSDQNYTFTMPAEDLSYDAFGHKNTYKVAYNANGGSGTMSTSTFYYDTDETLTLNSFTRLGYTFQGWATSIANAEAGTITYSDGATVKNLTAVQDETITLYAVWKPTTKMYIYAKDSNGNLTWMPALKYVYSTQTSSG